VRSAAMALPAGAAISEPMMSNQTAFDSLLTGARSVFGFSRSAALTPWLKRQAVEERMHNNFARVGQSLDNATRNFGNEQKTQSRSAQ